MENNRDGWTELAQQGNPFLLLNARHYDETQTPFEPPADVPDTWTYRFIAQESLTVAYAASDASSPHRGRADLVNNAVAMIDWLVEQCAPEGYWWKPKRGIGDPNVNRFTLSPLLDAVRWLRLLPEGEAAWPRWEQKLATAVDLQRRAYQNGGEVWWDWAGQAGGEYANQDVYYMLIMALSAQLWQRPSDQELAHAMMKQVATNLLPNGGFHYIGVENEAPLYHGINLIILGRYATLTKDSVAADVLLGTANYYPLTLTAEAQPEYWSDVWWKQTWGFVQPQALVIAAGTTRDARNQWLMWRALERKAPVDGGMSDIYCAPYWPGTAAGQPLPEQFITADRNIRGLRGRDGQWYFGATQGRGLRNTFVGGLITHPQSADPLQAAFRGAQIDVLTDDAKANGLWLSQMDDFSGVALRPASESTLGAGGLGVRYTPQPSTINSIPIPTTKPAPWQVTQIWRAASDGIIGVVALEATADTSAVAVAGRLALGPNQLQEEGANSWSSGPLRVKLFQSFGAVALRPVTCFLESYAVSSWEGVEMKQALPQHAVKKGERFVYAAWLGPATAAPPDELQLLPNDTGWLAQWNDGRCVATLFNATQQPQNMSVVWPGKTPSAWNGEDGEEHPLEMDSGNVGVSLRAGECILLEGS